MDQSDARAVTPEVERGDGGGVLAADDDDIEAEEGVRIVVVMLHLAELFAGDVEFVGQVVVSGGEDELARAVSEWASEAVGGVDGELVVVAGDALDRLVGAQVERVVLGDLAVVFERLRAAGLLVGGGEGDVADLQQLRRGEEGHVRGVVEEGVAETALVDHEGGESAALGLDGAGQTGGAGADDEQVV
jgi:hypothetical protein